jgi:hypothetical protein
MRKHTHLISAMLRRHADSKPLTIWPNLSSLEVGSSSSDFKARRVGPTRSISQDSSLSRSGPWFRLVDECWLKKNPPLYISIATPRISSFITESCIEEATIRNAAKQAMIKLIISSGVTAQALLTL